MKSKQTVLRIVMVIVVLALLAGCTTATPTAAPTAVPIIPATPAPTLDQAATLSVLGTQVAQTYVANQTLNAPTATPIPPTATLAPATPGTTGVPTNTPLPPTATQAATPTNTSVSSTNTPVPTSTPVQPTVAFVFPTITPQFSPTPKPYDCAVLSVSPKPLDPNKAGSDFTGAWVVINTGTQTWPQAQTDVKYVSGEKFQLNGDIVDLSNDVSSGRYYDVYVNMKAPKYIGRILQPGPSCPAARRCAH
jgi:hypothetical protein